MLDAELDHLQWWRVHTRMLPIMAKLARKYLNVCVLVAHHLSEYLAAQETLLLKMDSFKIK